jgi:DUF3014 family protein
MDDLRRRESDVADYELVKAGDPSFDDRPRRAKTVLALVALALVAAAAVAVYIVLARRQMPPAQPAASPSRPAASTEAERPLGGDPFAVQVPPLDQSDAIVRQLVREVTSHPQVLAWLATEGLLRNVAVVIENTAEGATPAVHLRTLRPTAPFAVVQTPAGLAIDPKSYHRYDAVAAAAASVDAAAAARLYATVKPRLQDAFRDLDSETPLDRSFERAVVQLLNTPVVNDPVLVRPQGGTGYAFVDPKLEGLTAAQKQLLRTGPANVRTIQTALRSIALALGIPSDRLPAARTQTTSRN